MIDAKFAPTFTVQYRGSLKTLRGLIWIYLLLLIFEGFLRMVLPSLSNALLVVRDPFLIAAYLIAHVSKAFPWNKFVVMFWTLGLIALTIGYFLNPGHPLVSLFGFRAAFFHVPLIFLIPRVMNEDDVVTIGKWILIICIPMALLMAAQFHNGPSHWLNRGIDNQFAQITSTGGKIRPSGTFSYNMGPNLFYACAVAYIMYAQFHPGKIARPLVLMSTAATCLALAVSGSRSALAGVCLVIITALVVITILDPKKSTGFVKFALVVGIGLFVAAQFSIFSEGVDIFSTRIENASRNEGGLVGFINRALGEYLQGINAVGEANLTGAGLGVGTNAGAALLSGDRRFLLAEGEWSRVVLELGPFIGVIYLLMRTGLVGWLFTQCIKSIRSGLMLPILLFGAFGQIILSGQWAQATALGFAAMGGGLILAATQRNSYSVDKVSP